MMKFREVPDKKEFDGYGFKVYAWTQYITKIDRLRYELIPDYDPTNLSPEIQEWDRENFEKYYANRMKKYEKMSAD